MKRVIMKTGIVIPVFAIALALALTMATAASAALPAPNWLPGQPMLAGTNVIAMWLPIPGAVKYRIYLDGKLLVESPANQYIGAAPAAGGQFKYQVAAVDASGSEGALSTEGIIIVKIITPPAAPIYRVDPDGKAIFIRWDSIDGATIYNLYRSDSRDGNYKLVTSTTELAYKETEVPVGTTYYYSVSAKDMTGKESSRGEVSSVVMTEVEVAKTAARSKAYKLVIVPTKPDQEWENFDNPDTDGEPISIRSTVALRKGPDGLIYWVGMSDRIAVLNDDFEVESLITVAEGARGKKFRDIAISDDGILYVTDRSYVHAIDSGNGKVLWSYKGVQPTLKQDPEVYKAIAARYRTAPPYMAALGILADGRIMVNDGQTDIFHILTADGELDRWFVNYKDGDKTKRVSNGMDVIGMSDGTVIISQSLGRSVLRLDVTKDFEMVWRAGQFSGRVGNFIGMGGMTFTSDGNLLVTDPVMSTMNVYNIETGKYMYSFGGPTGKPMANDADRPALDFNKPTKPMFFKGGKSLVIFAGMRKIFMERVIAGDIPVLATGSD